MFLSIMKLITWVTFDSISLLFDGEYVMPGNVSPAAEYVSVTEVNGNVLNLYI